jgi:hypothetical protein
LFNGALMDSNQTEKPKDMGESGKSFDYNSVPQLTSCNCKIDHDKLVRILEKNASDINLLKSSIDLLKIYIFGLLVLIIITGVS